MCFALRGQHSGRLTLLPTKTILKKSSLTCGMPASPRNGAGLRSMLLGRQVPPRAKRFAHTTLLTLQGCGSTLADLRSNLNADRFEQPGLQAMAEHRKSHNSRNASGERPLFISLRSDCPQRWSSGDYDENLGLSRNALGRGVPAYVTTAWQPQFSPKQLGSPNLLSVGRTERAFPATKWRLRRA